MTGGCKPTNKHLIDFGTEEYEIVAWHGRATFSGVLQTSARHLRKLDSHRTLCGVKVPWASRRVTPTAYWTDKDCERCMRSVTQGNHTRRQSLEVA